MSGPTGGELYDPSSFIVMICAWSWLGHTRRLPNSSTKRQPSEYISTETPLRFFRNTSGAIYGTVPGPGRVDVKSMIH